MSKKILIAFNWLAAGLLTLGLIFAAFMPQAFLNKEDWVQSPVLIIVTIGILILINGFKKGIDLMSPKVYRIFLISTIALIALVQLWVSFNFIEVARGDVYFVQNQAISLAQGSHVWNDYFKVYPNNVNTALLEAALIKPFLKIGVTAPWAWLNALRFIWIDTGLVSGLYILKKLNIWRPAALFLTVTWLFSIPVYGYGLFAYNDALIMPLVLNVAALGLIFKNSTGKIRWLSGIGSWVLLAFATVMKSNLVVLWVAIAMVLLIASFAKMIEWKLALKWLVGAVLVMALTMGLASTIAKSNGYTKNPDQATPVTSWIAMSLNPQTQGQYSGRDFYSIRAEKTAAAKKDLAQKRIHERVAEMGPAGLMFHFVQKLGVFLSHGDFDALTLGHQWLKAPAGYLSHQRTADFWALLVTQCWYLAMLVGVIWQLIRQKQNLLLMSVLSLFVLGLTAFHVLIWEVEPRYSLPILPVIMLLGTIGWSTAPQIALNTSRRVAMSGLMAVGIFLSTLSIIGTIEQSNMRNIAIARQGVGQYFNPQVEQIHPGQKFDFNIPMHGHDSNQLTLSTMSQEPVTISIRDQKQLLAQVTDRADVIKKIYYPSTKANRLNISIINQGYTPVQYAGGVTNYSIDTGAILPRGQMNLQWKVDQADRNPFFPPRKVRSTPAMSPRVVISIASIFMVSILAVTWFKPRTIRQLFSRN